MKERFAGRPDGRCPLRQRRGERKVRAPQGAVVGNAHRPRRLSGCRRTGKVQQKGYRLGWWTVDGGRWTVRRQLELRQLAPRLAFSPSTVHRPPSTTPGKGEMAG